MTKINLHESLIDCVNGYEIDEQSIHPISAVDAQIIDSLCSVLFQLENKELYTLVSSWKTLPDIDTLTLIRNLIKNGFSENNVERRNFILFESGSIDVNMILSIDTDDSYNYLKECFEYYIIINKTTSETTKYGNKTYCFSSKEKRDRKFDELHTLIDNTKTINFF